MVRHKRGLVGLSAVVLFSFAACGDEPAAALRAAIAEGCSINSECASPLVCAFRTCHIECESTRDCVAYGGGLCVQSDKPYKVCQNPEEQTCGLNSECPGKEVCGVDGKCRDACVVDRDCIAGQKCTAGSCADPVDLIDGKLPAKTAPQGGLSCLRASDCPGDLVCKFNTCAVECVTPKDCEDGLPCIDSRCQTPVVGSGGRGGNGGSGAGTGGSSATGGSAGNPSGGSGGAGAVSGSAGASGATAGTGGSAGAGGAFAGNGGGAGASGGGQGGTGAGAAAGSAGAVGGSAGASGEGGQSGGVGGAGQSGAAGNAGSAGAGGGPSPPPLDFTVLATTEGSTYLALDKDNVYWMTVVGTAPDTKGTVYTMPKLGDKPATIVSNAQPVALGLDTASVYWGQFAKTGNLFFTSKTVATKPKNLTAGIVNLTDFAVEEGSIVYTDETSVSFIDLVEPKNNRTLVAGASKPYTMTRREGFVFWADAQAETAIFRAPIGPTPIKIAEALMIAKAPKTKPQGIAVDATHVFWTEPETRLVRSASVDGGGEKTLVTAKVSPFEIALDDNRVYWTGSNDVSSMKKDGTDVVTYKAAPGKAHRAIAVDDTWVFWVDAALGTVNRIGK